MAKRSFFRTVISIEILSDEEYNPESLYQIHRDSEDKDFFSCVWNVIGHNTETPETMAMMALSQGIQPGYFGLHQDEDGKWYSEDEEDDSEGT